MDQQELRAAISSIQGTLEESAKVDAQSPTDKIFAALLLTGISVVGEMLLDIKRIADASSPSVQMVARLLAEKEAVRKDVENDIAESAEARAARHGRFVDGNWPAFQREAAELLAAAQRGRT